MGILCLALWSLFVALTPTAYKSRRFPKWPGAVATSLWWYGTTLLLPPTLSLLGGYGRTYGSLAGVMITLIFFFLVGLGVVIGADLNAALAEFPEDVANAFAQVGLHREVMQAPADPAAEPEVAAPLLQAAILQGQNRTADSLAILETQVDPDTVSSDLASVRAVASPAASP